MILLLGKTNAIEKYLESLKDIDVRNDVVYYPSSTTHYTDFPKYIDVAKEENPPIIVTQSSEMIDMLLGSDLQIDKIITAYLGDSQKVFVRELTKEKAKEAKYIMGLELR